MARPAASTSRTSSTQPRLGFQQRVIALCFLVVAIDGFDTAAIGFIAPSLRQNGA